ncbi:GDSL esterase/lipase 7-like [Papaver somniferum]|nr:GDSL esterase/lipase 7-like [Papaver somniferum]
MAVSRESYFFMSINSLSFLFCLTMFMGKSSGAGVPAIYLIGDSLLDNGNNNFLQTIAKSNYTPYGIDFITGPTGRTTNGATGGDFIAQFLGLPYPPAYLSLSQASRKITTTGITYASGASGILPESGSAMGDILSLDEQINYFNSTVTNDLPTIYSIPAILSAKLAKSIFVISTGSNDYFNNYLQPQFYNSSQTYSPQQFADLLLNTFEQQLTTIYKLGGRKFLVYSLGALGCLPIVRAGANLTSMCLEDVNNLINLYNNGLPTMLQRLTSTLQGSTFVRADLFTLGIDQFQDPVRFGFSDGRTPCCNFDVSGKCIPGGTPCSDRDDRLYYDAIHPSEAVNYKFARDCFFQRNSKYCTPLNVQQLALK